MKTPPRLRSRWVPVTVTLLLVALCSSLAAPWNIGGYAFETGPSSPPLLATVSPSGLSSYRFVGDVGGIAFSQVAAPEDGVPVGSVGLDYDRTQPDGSRLRVWLHGVACDAPLADWLLIPIAAYADSDYNATVSLFGPATTNSTYDIVYHPAFQNTLLGLRLLQSDILLTDLNNMWRMPSQDGVTPYGVGERDTRVTREGGTLRLEWRGGPLGSAPTVTGPYAILGHAISPLVVTASGPQTFYRVLDGQFDPTAAIRISEALDGEEFQSWVLTDVESGVRFSRQGNALRFTGDQYYHFWIADFGTYSREVDRLLAEANAALAQNDIPHYNAIVAQINALEPVVSAVTPATANLRRNTESLRAFNPIAFNAAQATMQYAAFFRYVKQRNPDGWSAFLSKTRGVPIQPRIQTPSRWTRSF